MLDTVSWALPGARVAVGVGVGVVPGIKVAVGVGVVPGIKVDVDVGVGVAGGGAISVPVAVGVDVFVGVPGTGDVGVGVAAGVQLTAHRIAASKSRQPSSVRFVPVALWKPTRRAGANNPTIIAPCS